MPTFRVIHSTQAVNGSLHHHARLLSRRGDHWAVCGVLQLHPAEWEWFVLSCEVLSIEVADEVPAEATKAPTAV